MSKAENEHPAVIVHPVRRRKSVYVNNWPCKRFTGMSPEETAPLKVYLNTLATQRKNVYKHDWEEGDLMLGDGERQGCGVRSDSLFVLGFGRLSYIELCVGDVTRVL